MKRYEKAISIDQALIMALKMHDRNDCGLIRAVISGLQIRSQLNWLDEMGIDRKQFFEMVDESKNGPIIRKSN